MIGQIAFIAISSAAFYFAYRQFSTLYKKIMLGKPLEDQIVDRSERWSATFLIAFGQKKMFKRVVPALFHLFIYIAFLFTQVELIEILIDGILGTHRIFASALGSFYTFIINLIEILSVLAFIATVVFLIRRNLIKVPRLTMNEMNGWPKLDGNIILYLEILLLIGIFTMNGTDVLLQSMDPQHYPDTGHLMVSSKLGPALFSSFDVKTLSTLERMGWWLHFIVVLVFLNYLPKSKHLHILLAFPNTWYNAINNRGEMKNMPEIMNEVKSLMGLSDNDIAPDMSEELPEFGVHDIQDLEWTQVLSAYTCTECGRCTDECPANQTGKKLSPRKIMMDVRNRTDEIYVNAHKEGKTTNTYQDDKSLFDYISREEIHACTTCNACVEACPVMINPMNIILGLRRYEILSLSEGPKEWLPMFNSIENSGSAWQMNKSRLDWVNE